MKIVFTAQRADIDHLFTHLVLVGDSRQDPHWTPCGFSAELYVTCWVPLMCSPRSEVCSDMEGL